MKKKTADIYTNGPIKMGKMVKDFLPKPRELVMKEPTVKVTISLKSESVAFFKKEAERLKTSYQKMIRNLLDEYTKRMKQQ